MSNSESTPVEGQGKNSSLDSLPGNGSITKKGPLSFLSGALTSGLLAWLCLGISQKMVMYFALHSPSYNSAFAQSIASGFKTLVIGISFLATFSFAFIGLGLTLVFIRSLFSARNQDTV